MKLFVSLFSLFLCTSIGAQSSTLLSEFEQKWRNASDYTKEIAEQMPAEHFDFQPAADMRTFKEQLMHMMGNVVWLSSGYLGGGEFQSDLKRRDYTRVEVLRLLDETSAFAANAIKNLKPEELDDAVDFFAGPMTKRQILTLLNDHLTHHRGQIIVYLRLKDIKPARYRGW
jgi:uncharacterized damage-inducible protein DinB